MVRISKQQEKRSVSRRRPAHPTKKTGPLKDQLPLGYKQHKNSIEGSLAQMLFIPKIK